MKTLLNLLLALTLFPFAASAAENITFEYACADYNKISAALPEAKLFKDVEAQFSKKKDTSEQFRKFIAMNMLFANTKLNTLGKNQKAPKTKEQVFQDIQNVSDAVREYYLICKNIPGGGFAFVKKNDKTMVADAIGINYAGKNAAFVEKLLKNDKTKLPQNMNAVVEAIYKSQLGRKK